jgi:hypothetical protein
MQSGTSMALTTFLSPVTHTKLVTTYKQSSQRKNMAKKCFFKQQRAAYPEQRPSTERCQPHVQKMHPTSFRPKFIVFHDYSPLFESIT